MRDNIALIGEWNTTNIGDRAIGLHATQYLLSFGFKVKLIALGSFNYLGDVANGEDLAKFFSTPPNNNNRTEDFMKGIIHRGVHKYFPGMKFFFRFWRNFLNRKPLMKELSQCKGVLVGGGALLDDDGLHFPSSLLLIKIMSQHLNLPLYSVGCSSSGKFSWVGKFILKDFLNYADLVAVRDESSRQVLQPLRNNDIYIFGDFALPAERISRRKVNDNINRVGINVMHFTGGDKEEQAGYEFFLTQLITALRTREGLSIRLFTTGDINDLEIANKINAAVGLGGPVFHPQTFQDSVIFLKDNDLVLCTRLHSAIMAINEGTPAVVLWVRSKSKNFFSTIGLKSFCVRAVPHKNINQMISDVLDIELPSYFSLINLDCFSKGQDKVFRTLSALRNHGN